MIKRRAVVTNGNKFIGNKFQLMGKKSLIGCSKSENKEVVSDTISL